MIFKTTINRKFDRQVIGETTERPTVMALNGHINNTWYLHSLIIDESHGYVLGN